LEVVMGNEHGELADKVTTLSVVDSKRPRAEPLDLNADAVGPSSFQLQATARSRRSREGSGDV
jgi:hypothetical protein